MADPLVRRPTALLAAAPAAAFWLLYSRAPVGVEGDFWWHLKAGQLLLGGHAPFKTDPFSFTAAGHPWIQHEWLGEVAFAWIHALAGVDGVRTAYWLLLAICFGVVAAVFLEAGCKLPVAAFGSLAIHLHLYSQLWPRMQGFTLLGTAATVLVLQRRWARRDLGRAIWLYPAGVAIWANLHGGAIAGPVCCTLVLLAELPGLVKGKATGSSPASRAPRAPMDFERIEYRLEKSGPPALGPLVVMTVLAWLALLATPAGMDLPRFVLATFTDPEFRAMYAMVAEWGPFRLDYSTCQHFLAWCALLAIAAIAAGPRAVPAGAWILFLPWAMLTFVSRRHLPLGAITSAPLAAWLFSAAFAGLPDRGPGVRRFFKVGGLAAVSFLFIPPALDLTLSGPFETGLRWPSPQALEAALREGRSGRRLFNLYDWGGLLIYHGHPAMKVFIDGRQDAYGLELNLAHHRIAGAAPGWERDLARWSIDGVFVPPEAPIVQALLATPNATGHAWKVAYQDRSAVILLKERSAASLSWRPRQP